MECLADDTANCNISCVCPECGSHVPASSLNLLQPRVMCSKCVSNNRSNLSVSADSSLAGASDRLVSNNSNNNVQQFLTAENQLQMPFHHLSINGCNSLSVCHSLSPQTVHVETASTQSQYSTLTSSQALSSDASAYKLSSHIGAKPNESICLSNSNSLSSVRPAPCSKSHPGGGSRISLESYLIPDPEARAELERRLRAYSWAASQDSQSPTATSAAATSPAPQNLNKHHFDNEHSSLVDNSRSDVRENITEAQREIVVPSILVTQSSDASLVSSTLEDAATSSIGHGKHVPRDHCSPNVAGTPVDNRLLSPQSKPAVCRNELDPQTSGTNGCPKCSSRRSRYNRSHGSSRQAAESGHQRCSCLRRDRKVKASREVCSRREFLAQLHGELADSDVEDAGDFLSDDVVSSLGVYNYTIHEILGKGISSTVRRVTEKTTGVEYAVKIIDISGEKGEHDQVEQIKRDTFREIRILRMCGGHPNIIELRDVFETPTFIFLVFEICKKGELFDYLTSVISLSEKRTRIFMRQLFLAVQFFHEQDIVHRDLKPENILLDDNLNIKVSDFGFATVLEQGEELSELCGTPGYLAPEVLAHSMYENVSGYGKEVDMWACGVIMYTLLCGAPPFWHRRQMMMLRAIMNADYTFNTPEWDDITEAPKNLIQQLLVVNPQQRLTAKQALAHPFFCSQIVEEKKFQGKRKFKVGAHCIIFFVRLGRTARHPPPILVSTVRENPYSIKVMRKAIDASAFSMYKHWVKRVENQNRAALFEHTLRDDWRHSLAALNKDRSQMRY
ncbi:phosphorylase b kinase gamma catalytic chain, skeletal muscle isoform [Plakobranchus ocellatus]|uniref:phosphorylase kinase n=1 Tax=Plakobranchus ocellatus TaxID=259542 RepID=A0AAV3ZY21_9GAST|nr:phosphorylase b kinase gamma catalytic chain, skeletal muscle isoform [Plakobranchus ocellatus]